MTAARRSRAEQLPLGIPSEPEDSWVICRGVFSANYLRKHFAQSRDFPKADDVRPAYDKLKAVWHDEYVGLCKRKEAYRSQSKSELITAP